MTPPEHVTSEHVARAALARCHFKLTAVTVARAEAAAKAGKHAGGGLRHLEGEADGAGGDALEDVGEHLEREALRLRLPREPLCQRLGDGENLLGVAGKAVREGEEESSVSAFSSSSIA
eukprot:CAMPEP_0181322142 /NCGR_PEP_ID=MMETSP1101-20121128/19069_1 /TAXON_ID=46948 /ORGANISM="Rhodomonas abbreviata, Strain Caron Lab Isolate" /LENGTH=118 /DNA_ID=CAMNT_0023430033 /DNA_START=125 /DNA_END=481 /DNA_ORIENTATION=+